MLVVPTNRRVVRKRLFRPLRLCGAKATQTRALNDNTFAPRIRIKRAMRSFTGLACREERSLSSCRPSYAHVPSTELPVERPTFHAFL
jgi:hypothetical protein